jgi:hypothetical protein
LKQHLLTVAVLAAAFALYATGMQGGGARVFVAGAALELWFWVRLVRRRRGTARPAPGLLRRTLRPRTWT